jgi:hypothetical protein
LQIDRNGLTRGLVDLDQDSPIQSRFPTDAPDVRIDS